jgi:hypothetical protein
MTMRWRQGRMRTAGEDFSMNIVIFLLPSSVIGFDHAETARRVGGPLIATAAVRRDPGKTMGNI